AVLLSGVMAMAKSKRKLNLDAYIILTDLIKIIYQATQEPACWVRVLETLSAFYGGHPVGLFSYDLKNKIFCADNPVVSSHFVHADPDWIAEFKRYYWSINPWLERSISLPDSTVVCSSSLIPDEILTTTEFYTQWLNRHHYKYSLMAKLLKSDSRIYNLIVLRTDPLSRSELEFARQLVPHLSQAINIQANLARSRALGNAHGSVLDHLDMGVLLLDDTKRVRFNNTACDAIRQKNDGFFIDDDRCCHGGTPEETKQLNQLIGQAVLNGQGRQLTPGHVMHLNRKAPGKPLSVLVRSLPCQEIIPADKICVVAFISDPDEETQKDGVLELLKQLYGLTLAQSQLALALGNGVSIEHYAEQQQLSLNTVRTHLKQRLAKTKTHRQGELIRVLLTGPAFMNHTPVNTQSSNLTCMSDAP
ncbi:MAG: helix-turn-helix transcriptional regulator, partial [Methylococcaceae bacterium]